MTDQSEDGPSLPRTPKTRRRSRRTPKPRYSPAQRSELLSEYNLLLGQGKLQAEAVAGLGVSLTTMYRWKYAMKPSVAIPPPTQSQTLSVDNAIKRLAEDDNKDRLSFLEALLKLVAWLRWPASPKEHPAAITVCIASYLSQGSAAEVLGDLPPEDLQLVMRNLRTDTLKRMFSNESYVLPIFELFPIREQNYNELDFFAEICWFLLAYEPRTKDVRDGPSVGKSYYASQNGLFRYKWPLSENVFRRYWRNFGVASPFIYIERFHSNLDLTLNPLASEFSITVDDLMNKPVELRGHLARCRSAVEMLRSRLHPHALQHLEFPTFPESLPPLEIEPQPLPAAITSIMEKFGRGDRRAKSVR